LNKQAADNIFSSWI